MNDSTRMRQTVFHLGVFLVVGVLQTGNYVEADSIYVLHTEKMAWPKAHDECDKSGGILVKINSQQEMDDLLRMDNAFAGIISGGEFWTGLNTTTQSCTDYIWDGGFPATWLVWDRNAGEPDACGDSKCIRLRHGLMRTIPCSSEYPFICQTLQEETTTTAPTTASSTTTTTTATTSTTTTPTTTTTEGTTGDSIQQEETPSTPLNTSLTEAELTTIPSTDGTSTPSEVTSTIATKKENITTVNDDSLLRETTTGMVGRITVVTSDTPGNITCLCNTNVQNNTTPLHGVIPSSTAHHNSLVISGYAPACSESIVWDSGFLTREEQMALLSDLKKQLNVAKNTTSTYKRRHISVYDNRVSATSVGALGVCLLVGVFGTFVAADASRLYTYCTKL